MYNYERLIFFQKAEVALKKIHILTLSFPKFETYELGSQMRRALDSIVFNISEGGSKGSVADMSNYLRHALGSVLEVKTQVARAFERGYISFEEEVELRMELDEIGKMINGFMGKLRRGDLKGR